MVFEGRKEKDGMLCLFKNRNSDKKRRGDENLKGKKPLSLFARIDRNKSYVSIQGQIRKNRSNNP